MTESASRDTGWLFYLICSLRIIFYFKIIAINKLVNNKFMSFATYYMHLIFAAIPSLISSNSVLYILPLLIASILFFSLKIMFYDAPKLRRAK